MARFARGSAFGTCRVTAPTKSSPNDVSSQAPKEDAEHTFAPLKSRGNGAEAPTTLRKVIDAMRRTHVVKHDAGYLYAEFRSQRMSFVNDVEFLVSEPESVIHVRSASRLGRRDFGVNRARIEAIRRRFEAAQGPSVKAWDPSRYPYTLLALAPPPTA